MLEIILAVGIGVIFMGGAVVFLSSTGGDRELIESRKMLEEQAGMAREKALATGQEQRIRLDARAVAGQEFPGEVEMEVVTPRDLALGRRSWENRTTIFGSSPAEAWSSRSACASTMAKIARLLILTR